MQWPSVVFMLSTNIHTSRSQSLHSSSGSSSGLLQNYIEQCVPYFDGKIKRALNPQPGRGAIYRAPGVRRDGRPYKEVRGNMIHYETQNQIAVLKMEHGKVNAIDIEFLQELNGHLDHLATSDERAV